MSTATALLLRRGDRVALDLEGHSPMYGVVTGKVTYSPYGQRLVPVRTTAAHRLHPKGQVLCAPAACIRRRPAGRHAGQRRPWWRGVAR